MHVGMTDSAHLMWLRFQAKVSVSVVGLIIQLSVLFKYLGTSDAIRWAQLKFDIAELERRITEAERKRSSRKSS